MQESSGRRGRLPTYQHQLCPGPPVIDYYTVSVDLLYECARLGGLNTINEPKSFHTIAAALQDKERETNGVKDVTANPTKKTLGLNRPHDLSPREIDRAGSMECCHRFILGDLGRFTPTGDGEDHPKEVESQEVEPAVEGTGRIVITDNQPELTKNVTGPGLGRDGMEGCARDLIAIQDSPGGRMLAAMFG